MDGTRPLQANNALQLQLVHCSGDIDFYEPLVIKPERQILKRVSNAFRALQV